jgi:NAD(P)H-nitrite reductase large subunit
MDREILRQIDQVEELLEPYQPEKIDDEVLVCECFCVSAADIRQTLDEAKVVDLDLLQKHFSLGLGCGSCLKKKDYWIDKIF